MKRFTITGIILPIVTILLLTVLSSFEAFSVNDDVITYSVSGEQCFVQSCDTNAVGEILIPDTHNGVVVTSIRDGAFKDCSGISSVVLPETIKTVGNEAFSGCVNLTTVNIPDSVISLGESLFYKCGNLTDVSLSASLTEIPEKAFYYCVRLQNITLPSGIVSIKQDAFYECRALEKAVLPESIAKLSAASFKNCSTLESLYIPEGLVEIGVGAFDGCYNLSVVHYSGSEESAEKINILPNNQLLRDAVWRFNHLHSENVLTNNIEAGCTKEGYSEFFCGCGFYGRINFVPSLGHDLSVFDVLKQPDCKNEGLRI